MENCVSQFKGWFGKSKIKVKCVWTDLDECSEKSTQVKRIFGLEEKLWVGNKKKLQIKDTTLFSKNAGGSNAL